MKITDIDVTDTGKTCIQFQDALNRLSENPDDDDARLIIRIISSSYVWDMALEFRSFRLIPICYALSAIEQTWGDLSTNISDKDRQHCISDAIAYLTGEETIIHTHQFVCNNQPRNYHRLKPITPVWYNGLQPLLDDIIGNQVLDEKHLIGILDVANKVGKCSVAGHILGEFIMTVTLRENPNPYDKLAWQDVIKEVLSSWEQSKVNWDLLRKMADRLGRRVPYKVTIICKGCSSVCWTLSE